MSDHDMPLTTTGDQEAERRARNMLTFCTIVFDEVLYLAYMAWRCRFYTGNPFR